MDLLLSPGSLCRSTTIGALVAPFSPVGRTGCPMRLFSTADLPEPTLPSATALRKVVGRRGAASSEGSSSARSEAAWRIDSESSDSSSMASMVGGLPGGSGGGSQGIGRCGGGGDRARRCPEPTRI
uniref:Uncharacterized protein n=1 Tax=Arundo donax TaxID=35708 RepID=A0A0A8YMA7_ARUDO